MGVQANAPVCALIEAPPGAPASREKVSVWPASGSVAEAVNVSATSSLTVRSGGAARAGARFGGRTFTVKARELESAGTPLSVTTTVIAKEPAGPVA